MQINFGDLYRGSAYAEASVFAKATNVTRRRDKWRGFDGLWSTPGLGRWFWRLAKTTFAFIRTQPSTTRRASSDAKVDQLSLVPRHLYIVQA
ncbi:MAG: hypothetical protein QOH39_224 [Verrucomicrobiota bacterium]|jgi:predicted acetyltransferase